MSYAGMLRFRSQNTVQNFSGYFLIRIALVISHHPRRNERQRVEDSRLAIFRVAPVKSLHCLAVSKRARPVIEFVCIFVKDCDGCHIVSLTLGACAKGGCPQDGRFPLLQFRWCWRCPDGMVVAHRDSPIAHTTFLIDHGDMSESFLRLLVLERM